MQKPPNWGVVRRLSSGNKIENFTLEYTAACVGKACREPLMYSMIKNITTKS